MQNRLKSLLLTAAALILAVTSLRGMHLAFAHSILADVALPTDPAVKKYIGDHQRQLLQEFQEFLSIPNVADDPKNIWRNAKWIENAIEVSGGRTRLLDGGGSPAVFGVWNTPNANVTVLFYAHYDGQPVQGQHWLGGPWKPTIRADGRPESATIDLAKSAAIDTSWRVFARSTSDDKSAVFGILKAVEALRAVAIRPAINIKVFFEGEEEASSPTLEKILATNTELLHSDLVLFCDGPAHPSGRVALAFGARGEVNLDLTTYGPIRPLHSGAYANWAPNPALRLARLLASMTTDQGRISVHGYYDSVLAPTVEELQAVAAIPNTDIELRRELEIGIANSPDLRRDEAALWPTMNIKGIASGEVGRDAAYAIPTRAMASLDLRLVPNQEPAEVRRIVETHVREAGFYITHEVPTADELREHNKVARLSWADNGYPAFRTPIGGKTSAALVASVKSIPGEDPVIYPAIGAGLPLHYFAEYLKTPVIILSLANYDNNQHGANENVVISYVWRGIRVYAQIMTQLPSRVGEASVPLPASLGGR